MNQNGHPKANGHDLSLYGIPAMDRQPPRALESEQYILSACVYENHLIDEIVVLLKPEDFWRDIHQAFYRAILRLHAEGKPADFISVEQEMTRASGKDHCTSDEFLDLARTLGNQPHAVNWAYHADQVKGRAIERNLLEGGSQVTRLVYAHDIPVAEKVARAEQLIFSIGESRQDRLTVRADAAVRGFWETYDARENRIALGVPTGLRVLDAKIGGCLQNSSLVIAAARPGNGKTAFALRVAENSAVNGMPVQIFSIEMGVQELMDRIIAGVAKVNLKHLQIHSLLTEDEKARISRAAAIVEKWPLFINDATDWTVAEMAAEARRQKRQNGIGLLIVDYLQLLEGETDSDRQSRQEQVAKMSRGLKKLAKQLDIPIMALSQLNRNCESREDKRPRLADLRESGALEQDANMVLLLHYPEKHDPETADQGIVEVNVAKHRNGETGMVRLAFVKEFSRFEMLSREQAARYEKPRYDDDNF